MFVKPATPDVKLRDPHTKQHVPAAGIEVPDGDCYWLRRIADGDAVEVKPAAAAPAQKGKE